MKQITGFMSGYEDREIMGKSEALPREEQERILRGVMSRIQEENPPVHVIRRLPKTRKLLAVAAAALVITGASVFAAEKFSLGDAFSGWMGSPSQEQIEALGVSGHPLGLNQTVQGVTVTLQGMIGGKNAAYLLYDVQLPEGREFPETGFYHFENQDFMPEKSGSYGYHSELMSKEGNTLHFCLEIDSRRDLIGQQVVFSMDTLKNYDEDTEAVSVIAEGPWSFEFPMDYSDTSVNIPMKEKIKPWADGAITIKEIRVSPISVHLKCSRSVEATMEREYQDSRLLHGLNIRLCFADGSYIDDKDQITSSTGGEMLDIQVSRSYRKLIDLQQLTEIQITVEDNGEMKVYSVPVSIGK